MLPTNTMDIKHIISEIKEKDYPTSKYLEAEHRDFSLYTIAQRAIPLNNGLKPVQQRCLWQLRNVSKFEKVAKLTGMVMSIHPHGDCLDFDTEILLADGNYIKIGEWVENKPKVELLITAYDRENGKFISTNATPTNGKIVEELMEIEFENGGIIRSSTDHKFLLSDGFTYITADNLKITNQIKTTSSEMKIKSVKRIELNNPKQLYDISVMDYSNLIVKTNDTNIVIHNSSISDAINQMAGPYCNNISFFDGHGAFGTRIDPTAFGSPRYVAAKFSTFAKEVIFKDWEIVKLKPTYDETDWEPTMLLPLMPVLLLNGIQGIATGYSTMILPRNPKDIIERQIKVLKDQPIDNPLPYSKPIDNWAIRSKDNPNKYAFLGECEVLDSSTATITKLPLGMTHIKLIEMLTASVKKGNILNFINKSKAEVNITVTFKRAALRNKTGEFAARKLGLSSSVTERIIVLDAETSESVVEYNDAAKFIEDYTKWRLGFYPDRYKRLIELNDNELLRLNDIVIAIENDLGAKAKKIKSKNELTELVKSINIQDVEYIISLPIYRFTEDEYNKVKSKIDTLTQENIEYSGIIDDVQKQKDIFINELKEIKRKFKFNK